MQIHRKKKKLSKVVKYKDSIFDSAKSFSLKTLEAKSMLWEEQRQCYHAALLISPYLLMAPITDRMLDGPLIKLSMDIHVFVCYVPVTLGAT